MKKILILLFPIFLCICCQNKNKYNPNNSLEKQEQESFKYEIIRFAGRLVKQAKHETKFDTKFDEQYKNAASAMSLNWYYINPKDGYTYFDLSRVAPSLHERYVSTGGRLKKDEKGSIIEYEEIYRTWKLEKNDLLEKTAVFFDDMVHAKDLSKYYTANIGDTEHIEFPDENTFFNKESRKWETINNILSID